jgi:peptide/nickel transport system substrate-binding protein
MIRASLRKASLLATLSVAALCSQAQTVTVGLSADITSVDPHFHNYTPNQNISDHIFNRLVERNDQLRMVPGLAVSWRTIDDTTWEFKLRPGVTFHDGSPFTADDVVFSIERVPTLKDSPGLFSTYTKAITGITVVDPLTIRLKTAQPYPLLPNDLSVVSIVSKKAATGATSADFNSGKAAIGTGPFKLARFVRGERVELVRNDNYWGKKPQMQNLTVKILTNDAARVAALLANDVQLIDAVPVADVKRLTTNADLRVSQRTSTRLIYLYLDVSRDQSPFITDKDGKPLASNPLKDVRVRHALSKAIDRETIKARAMDGASRPTTQLLIPGLPGYVEALKVEAPDIEGAKKLLADAGYPNGFGLTLHGTNNRYVQDEQILQTVAQMLSRIGVAVKVEAQPAAVFFGRQNKGDYSVSMSGWAPDSAEGSSLLRAFIATRNKDKGLGTYNAGNYSNPKVDQLLETALATINDAEREKLLQQAIQLAIGTDQAVIPLHHQVNLWASRKEVTFSGRSDERTLAVDFVLQP